MLCSLAVCIIKKAIHTLTHARSVKEFVVALFSANLYPQKKLKEDTLNKQHNLINSNQLSW